MSISSSNSRSRSRSKPFQVLAAPLTLAVCLVLPASPMTAQIAFGPVQSLSGPFGIVSYRPIVADIDGDGDTDVLQRWVLSSKMGFAKNVGGGFSTLSVRPAVPLPGGVQAADLNGDGHLDLVSTSLPGIGVVLGLGHGRFGPVINSPGAQVTYSLGVADFDGDDLQDVMLYRSFGLGQIGQVDFRRGLGDGTFEAGQVVIPVGEQASSVVGTGDLDGNGLPDALVTTGFLGTGSKLFSVLSRGAGAFDVVEHSVAPAGPREMMLADLDGDRFPDLVVRDPGGLHLARGLGDGTFGTLQTAVASAEGSPVVADFDQDGHADLAWLPNDGSGAVGIYRQVRPMRFELVLTSTGWTDARELAVADVNGDGFPDLIATPGGAGMRWTLNRGAP